MAIVPPAINMGGNTGDFMIDSGAGSSILLAAAAPGAGGGLMDTLILLGPIILIFYFLLIRPQQKQVKQHKAMIEAIERGDTVTTAGGIIGKVTKVADDDVTVEIAEGVRVKIVRSTIGSVQPKNQPAND